MSSQAQILAHEGWKVAGAVAWGAAALTDLQAHLTEETGAKLQTLCPGAATVLVAAFPYYAGEYPGNLSLYCRGEDYHRVLTRRLESVCEALRGEYPGHGFVAGADNSPVPELAAAECAGVGFRGRHGLRIVPPYGSYVFLGTILTDVVLPSTGPAEKGQCPPVCRACQRACPTGALTDAGCDVTRCLSELTQQKGVLSPSAAAQVQRSPVIWGCDLCQRACPWNQSPALSPLPEFRSDLTASLTLSDLEGLSNKAFRKKFAHKAFAWRGIAPLQRNLTLQAEAPPQQPEHNAAPDHMTQTQDKIIQDKIIQNKMTKPS